MATLTELTVNMCLQDRVSHPLRVAEGRWKSFYRFWLIDGVVTKRANIPVKSK